MPTTRAKTRHQTSIESFMRRAGQGTPDRPTIPDEVTRLLRAKLILEEAFETVHALGFNLVLPDVSSESSGDQNVVFTWQEGRFVPHSDGPDMVEVADGCADLSVVNIGTLSAFGIADQPLLELIDESNLAKFDPPKCPECGYDMELISFVPTTEGGWATDASNELWRCLRAGNAHSYRPKEAGPYAREDGKWLKGSNWTPPDVAGLLALQSAEEDQPTESRPVPFAALDRLTDAVEAIAQATELPGLVPTEDPERREKFERAKLLFWRLKFAARIAILKELGVIPASTPIGKPIPQTHEGTFLEQIYGTGAVDRLVGVINEFAK